VALFAQALQLAIPEKLWVSAMSNHVIGHGGGHDQSFFEMEGAQWLDAQLPT
jgi:hypothetical protein